MNWQKMAQTLKRIARDQLVEAQGQLKNDEMHAAQTNLTSAAILLGIAEAIEEGLK